MAAARYHHGDLARALVQEGVRAVEESGAAALQVKALAAALGVSHAAVYRHFADRGALLAAIAREGFVQLEARVDSAFARSPGASRKQLLDVGFAAVAFAVEHPRLAELMMSGRVPTTTARPDDALAGAGESVGFLALVERVRGWQAAGVLGEGEPRELAFSLWVTTLGLVVLAMSGQLGLTKRALRTFVDRAHERLLDGLG